MAETSKDGTVIDSSADLLPKDVGSALEAYQQKQDDMGARNAAFNAWMKDNSHAAQAAAGNGIGDGYQSFADALFSSYGLTGDFVKDMAASQPELNDKNRKSSADQQGQGGAPNSGQQAQSNSGVVNALTGNLPGLRR